MPPTEFGLFAMDCRSICRIVNRRRNLCAGTAVLVSARGKTFGYALTCWHNIECPGQKLKDFTGEKKIRNVYLLPRWSDVEDEIPRRPVKVVGNWSSSVMDFAVLKIPAEVIRDFRLQPAPVSMDLYHGMKILAVGFQRPAELAEQSLIDDLWIPSHRDIDSSLFKELRNGQVVFEVWAERPIPWDTGLSGGALLHPDRKGASTGRTTDERCGQ